MEQLESIYLLYGEETYLLETALKKIKKQFGELVSGINYISIDENTINTLISELQTPAFGYEKKLIIARKTELFKRPKRKKEEIEEDKNVENQLLININEYIEKNIEQIKDSIILIFVEEDVAKNSLYKTIEKYGKVHNFEQLKPIELEKKIKIICNSYKVNIDNSTLQLFIETCGTDMSNLINEIRKLIEYAGENGTITKEDIKILSIKEFDSVIFDLTDSLGKKDTKQAVETLNELLYNKEPIQKILITLYNHFKKLYIVKLSEKYNRNIAESLKLKSNQMFLVSKYKRQASYFKEKELRKIMQELTNLDGNYKIGLIDINVGLEAILCTYC